MAAGAKARRQAQVDADAVRAASRADAAHRVERAEAERQAILADARQRAAVIVREAEREAADAAGRLNEVALLDAKRIREEAVEEILKLMSTLTTERDHILADARDDARRIVDAAQQARDASRVDVSTSTDGEHTDRAPEADTARHRVASTSELDELFFASAPDPAPIAPPSPVERRRRKRFGRNR